jgi:hypothetical protein
MRQCRLSLASPRGHACLLIAAAALTASGCGSAIKHSTSSPSSISTSGEALPRHSGISSDPGSVIIGPAQCGIVSGPAAGRYVVLASAERVCEAAMDFVSALARGAKHPIAHSFSCSVAGRRRVGICKSAGNGMFYWSWSAKGIHDYP